MDQSGCRHGMSIAGSYLTGSCFQKIRRERRTRSDKTPSCIPQLQADGLCLIIGAHEHFPVLPLS